MQSEMANIENTFCCPFEHCSIVFCDFLTYFLFSCNEYEFIAWINVDFELFPNYSLLTYTKIDQLKTYEHVNVHKSMNMYM